MNRHSQIVFALLSCLAYSCNSPEPEQKCSELKIFSNNEGQVRPGQHDLDNRYQYVVSLLNENNYASCSGFFISENIILTAAHCLKRLNGENIEIYGISDLQPISKIIYTKNAGKKSTFYKKYKSQYSVQSAKTHKQFNFLALPNLQIQERFIKTT